MKRQLVTLFLISLVIFAWGQNSSDRGVYPATDNHMLKKSAVNIHQNSSKNLTCIDTLRYPQTKEQILGTPSFYTFTLWTADAEWAAQTFILSGATTSVTGIEFFGRKAPASSANLVVECSIYNVDGSNIPTTSLGSTTITINDTVWNYRYATFSSAISVSGNYAVVIRPTSATGILGIYLNNATPNQSYDEDFARMKSSYYPNSNGAWVSPVTLTTGDATNFPTGPYNFEIIMAPLVSYGINTNFTMTPNPICPGTTVNFTNTTTPTSLLTNRMYDWDAFKTYFQATPDSNYAWDLDNGLGYIWSANSSSAYDTVGKHYPVLITLAGFWNSCVDYKVDSVTVNPLPVVTFTLSPDAICDTANAIALTGGSPAGGTYSGTGVSAGMFDPAVAGVGAHTLTYTYTDANTCTNNSTDVMTVDLCVGIETASISGWLISPNPVSEQLFISFNKATTDETAIQILSPEGRIVYNEKVSSASFNGTIDVSSLAKGLYIIRLVTGTEAVYNKIIVE